MPTSLVSSSDRLRAAGTRPAARGSSCALPDDHAPVLLANLGFLLVPGPPLHHGAAYLLTALRPRPTLSHFDPECISFWGIDSGVPTLVELTWPLADSKGSYSWGTIRVSDRRNAANGFVSFGGALSTTRDGELHAALFRSEAPILALAGRSGPADPLAAHVAAFLARLRGKAGYDSPVFSLARTLDPVALYAAFLNHTLDTYSKPPASDSVSAHVVSLLRAERHRLETDDRWEAEAGMELAHLILERST